MHKVEVATSSRNDGNTVLPAVLSPCPFCGTDPFINRKDASYIVMCPKCVTVQLCAIEKGVAISRWNQRPYTLRLNLKKKWYDMILSGEKKEEYREVKRYWIQRLCNEVEYEMGGDWEGVFKNFKQVEFKNGYGKNAPTMLVEFKGLRIGEAKPEWSDNWEGEVFAISLGAVLHSR